MKLSILLLIKNICEFINSNATDGTLTEAVTDKISNQCIEKYNDIIDLKRNEYIKRTGDVGGSLKYGYIHSRQDFWENKKNHRGKIGNACSMVISKMLFVVIFCIYSLVIVTSIFRANRNK